MLIKRGNLTNAKPLLSQMAVKELGSHTEPSNLDLFVSPKRLFEPFRSRTCGWVRLCVG